jgi:Ca2+:H+ antiporter
MGKPSDDSSTSDRSRSWARALAWNKDKRERASATKQAPILPTSEAHAHDGLSAITTTSPGSAGSSTAGPSRQATHHSSTDDTVLEKSDNAVADTTSTARPAAAPPPKDTKVEGEKSAAIDFAADPDNPSKPPKPPLTTRAKAGSKRFVIHTKDALFHSYINILLVFVPIGIACKIAGLNPAIVFAMNAVAIVPLAGLLAFATESVASRLGDTLGALLNVSFGNAVELIIFIIALVKNEIRVVQAALLGSILANLLLILGMAFAFGGLRYREQIYNSTVTQMSACLLSLSVMSLLLPTAFHASFSNTTSADYYTLKISRGTSVVLLLVYILFLVFQLKSHAYMYASMPQERIDEESHPGVLADILDSSTDSSSSSSSSDSDSSSGSVGTAKKFKRFIRKQRRKSSASSDTPSMPSMVSSPTMDPATGYFDESGRPSRRPSVILPDILSGDEGDTEVDRRHRFGAPKSHDYQDGNNGEVISHSPERKHKKKQKKHKKKRGKKTESIVPATETPIELTESPMEHFGTDSTAVSSPRVGFAANTEFRETTPTSKKAPLTFPRPALPKLLSSNVFVDPQPRASTGPNHARSNSAPGLRRTNSLPDRLNEVQSTRRTPGAMPLPPFVARSVLAAKTRPESAQADAEEEGEPVMSRTAAVMLLLISTGLVALCAEFLVDAIPEMTAESSVSQAFIGLIILPIVGNAAEHVTAVTVAAKNKMDLAIGVAVGSSIQIALFVTPLVVTLGWCMNKSMSLYFNLFETVSLFATVFVVNFLVLDGRSNYLEGTLLIAAYIIIA